MSPPAPSTWPDQPLAAALAVTPKAERDVRLWRFPLDEPLVGTEALARLLDDDEHARAARFVFDRDRQRFIAAHGMLRLLLGAWVGLPPQALRFTHQANGKPELAVGLQVPALHFNLSHAQGWGLLGASRAGELGVDIEGVREMTDWEQIARNVLAPSELACCLAQPPERRRDTFFAAWARKEAFIKASGAGLSIPLDSFEVSPVVDAPRSCLLRVDGNAAEAAEWQLLAWRWSGQHAALAMRVKEITVICATLRADPSSGG